MEGREVKSLATGQNFIVAVCDVLQGGMSQPLLHRLQNFSRPIIEPYDCKTFAHQRYSSIKSN